MHLLRVDASIQRESSVSHAVADSFQRAWTALHPDDEVTVRGLDPDPLPYLTLEHVLAAATEADRRTAEQRAAVAVGAELVDEVLAADVVLMAVPLYNWGVPALFKSWLDHVLNEPRVAAAQALFAGRTGVVVSARGGSYRPGAPREGWDHVEPYLRHVVGERLGLDLRIITPEFTLADVKPELAMFRDEAARSLADAHKAAEHLAAALTPAPSLTP
ncbi:FMN-dependent NADH-azoreductase [Bailinhaonella thermotolerans]|uniref:FMN dependent NADH:quinone oxidoreductase n=1 Tax=Bailinhaonella thermotolerans TaxID=1070861 RepID=A0A3A4BME7_9ACTN|nr:NAD(P)H-dependent oxidoreductase [Bailinhaonella thermotolerans]RJL32192.1 hypothetical protein D5H75_17495 [Bailinhaonella thermotolerans]